MLKNKWGKDQEQATTKKVLDIEKEKEVQNTGQYSNPDAKTEAEANGDFKNVIIAGRNSFILPINIPVKIPIALPSIALTGLQLPILSGSGDTIDESEVESDISKRL